MSLEKEQIAKPAQKDGSISNEKLPYVKPELHLLNLDGTEGKSPQSVEFSSQFTSFGIPATEKYGPS